MFKIKDNERVLMDATKTFAITFIDNLELEGFEVMSWDEFLELHEVQTLREVPVYNFTQLRMAKDIIKVFGFSFNDCKVYYYRAMSDEDRKPLVIEVTHESANGMAILVAPRYE